MRIPSCLRRDESLASAEERSRSFPVGRNRYRAKDSQKKKNRRRRAAQRHRRFPNLRALLERLPRAARFHPRRAPATRANQQQAQARRHTEKISPHRSTPPCSAIAVAPAFTAEDAK